MSMNSAIEWTETTWNPVTGCDRISPGCDNCYALTLAKRLKAMGSSKYQNNGDPRTSGPGFKVTFHENALTEPLRWRKPKRVFVNSMSDLAHARISDEAITRIFAVMALAYRHTFQILTKRPKRLADLLSRPGFREAVEGTAWHDYYHDVTTEWLDDAFQRGWPLPNVWLGTSIESDKYTWRADEIRRAPAAIRFLSCEPLLGPLPTLDLTDIHWLIAGGESGPQHRTLDLAWVRDLRDRCADQRIPFFFKQIGGHTPKAGGRELDGRTWTNTRPPSSTSRR